MSCSFKFCRGRGKCFLEGVSPCSEHVAETSEETEAMVRTMRRMGLSRSGFVESVVLSEGLGVTSGT
mgnify:CR=1 FL=1